MGIVFITGCTNSGATKLFQALELSKDVYGSMEPIPGLEILTRAMFESRLDNSYKPLTEYIGPKIAIGLNEKPVYIEKQPSLAPFIKNLSEIYNCRIIITIKDGREAVCSFIKQHKQVFSNNSSKCLELYDNTTNTLNLFDPNIFDFNQIHPSHKDPWYEKWKKFSIFERASWYWNFVNLSLIHQTKKIDQSRYLLLDLTEFKTEKIRSAYDFIGLTDFNEEVLKSNNFTDTVSRKERGIGNDYLPSWKEWSEDRIERFYDIAIDAMRFLGFDKNTIRKKPEGFGWREVKAEKDGNPNNKSHIDRHNSDGVFKKWFIQICKCKPGIESVIEVGWGLTFSHQDLFNDKKYIGIHFSDKVIKIEAAKNRNIHHRFLNCDIIQEAIDEKAELVVSEGCIDNVYDIDAFIRSIARMSKSLTYITSYRGYFKSLERHRYLWNSSMGIFYNNISPVQIEKIFREEGFKTILIFPQKENQGRIFPKTTIIASREKIPENKLMVQHEIYFEFKDYFVKPSEKTYNQIIDEVNECCSYYSLSKQNLVNSLMYFVKILDDLNNLSNLNLGSMEDLTKSGSGVNVGLRVDVDMDIVTALDMAKIAKQKSIVLSFYILHTASYYGKFDNGLFRRNEELDKIYKELEVLGSKVGLHIDPLMIYLEENINGAKALESELTWLRSLDIKVRGTSSHNAAPVYGAENFEIFKERVIHTSKILKRNYIYVPLGILSEEKLGLTYEAGMPKPPIKKKDERREYLYLKKLPSGDFLRNKRWFKEYIVDNPHNSWGYDYHIWIIGKDNWAIGGHDKFQQEVFFYNINWDSVLNFLSFVNKDNKITFTLHPIYFGRRNQYGKAPRFKN